MQRLEKFFGKESFILENVIKNGNGYERADLTIRLNCFREKTQKYEEYYTQAHCFDNSIGGNNPFNLAYLVFKCIDKFETDKFKIKNKIYTKQELIEKLNTLAKE